jgi:ribulose-5-phosphate 4-epimerase/fuculose-1-phosphate aldolase
MCVLGYRIFASHRWGQLGDGHISARDPELTDHFWLLDWGVPFGEATVEQLVLVGPNGDVMDAAGDPTGAVNTAGYNIHAPLLAARPDVVSACHTHTQFGTPWSANVQPFQALSQESTSFVFDQALFDDEEVEVLTTNGGKRIAAAIGDAKMCILRNHGVLTVGQSVEEAVGWFVMAERVAEVHVKAPNGVPISDEAAAIAAATMAAHITGWRVFQWLARGLS